MKISHFSVLAALLGLSPACAPSSDDGTQTEGNSNRPGIPLGSMVDIDGDGMADGTAIDTNADGIADAIDKNGDGKSDGPLPDTTMTVGGGATGGANTGGTGNTGLTPMGNPNDKDGDGFTEAEGDCEDNSAEINPGAYDFPGNEYDEDCDGTMAKKGDEICDTGLQINSNNAMDAAKAIGLCKTSTADGKGWGVIEAKFTLADGTGMIEDGKMVGLLPEFGAAKVREGKTLLALSSGIARAPGQSEYTEECDDFGATGLPVDPTCILTNSCDTTPKVGEQEAPAGFPKGSASCADQMVGGPETAAYNSVALELKVRAPKNAKSFAFDSIFYSYEYPYYVCEAYNDFFIVTKEPLPELVPDGNVLFDSKGEPIGVNTGLLNVCNASDLPAAAPKTVQCAQGTDLLIGTGFGPSEATCNVANTAKGYAFDASVGGASTGWLNTTVPISPGEVITLRFVIWDAGDPFLDSTALVDNFVWSVKDPEVATTPIIF